MNALFYGYAIYEDIVISKVHSLWFSILSHFPSAMENGYRYWMISCDMDDSWLDGIHLRFFAFKNSHGCDKALNTVHLRIAHFLFPQIIAHICSQLIPYFNLVKYLKIVLQKYA